jgi:hypothetical protein
MIIASVMLSSSFKPILIAACSQRNQLRSCGVPYKNGMVYYKCVRIEDFAVSEGVSSLGLDKDWKN